MDKLKEYQEALLDMVEQHCGDWKTGELDAHFLHANADAMRLLGRDGLIELDDRGHRAVFGKVMYSNNNKETVINEKMGKR